MRSNFQFEVACWRGICHLSVLRRSRWLLISTFVATFAGLSGCVTTTHVVGQFGQPALRTQTTVNGKPTADFAEGGPVSADEALGTDPCELRLQNIEAAMLLYYSINRTLPPALQDLVALSSDNLPLTCPVSHQDYLYIKDGLSIPGSPRKIIVCDATPAHMGKRWCIMMAPPVPGAALELEPEELPESVFQNLQMSP